MQFTASHWMRHYARADLRPDVVAGLTIGAMLVPQAMAYALLAGLPPEVGLYASTVPLIAYAVFGTSRQLAVGPVAIVSLMTASALGAIAPEGTTGYLAAAAVLALMVGVIHLVVGLARLGHLVDFLSHAVLVGFTAAAALIIGFSQAKHLFGISMDRQERLTETIVELIRQASTANAATALLGLGSLAAIFALRRIAPRAPSALIVVAAAIALSAGLDLESRGVAVVGNIPDQLPTFGLPSFEIGLIGDLAGTAMVITLVGFMESVAVAKVYARRHDYALDANRELVALGASNVASGLFGGYPVTGGFSRTAVNDTAGARTPMASVVTAIIVLVSIAFLTPLLALLPKAALAAIIIAAVTGLVDVAEMRHVAKVKRSDLIGMGVAFSATLALGIELGIALAIIASTLVVLARMSRPHIAVLGHVDGTTTFRNVDRFPEVHTSPGTRIVRIDSALTFVNAAAVRDALVEHARAIEGPTAALVIDGTGLNDLDATGVDMLAELLPALEADAVDVHLSDIKGPVRDVLRAAGLWSSLCGRIHASTHEAVVAIERGAMAPTDHRRHGIDERPPIDTARTMTVHSDDSMTPVTASVDEPRTTHTGMNPGANGLSAHMHHHPQETRIDA